jgi:RNA polymerase sigma-70 factor (ECF subfamily)
MNLTEFESLIRRHEKDIFSFCCYLTMDKSAADDLYQDTVLQAFESIGRIDAARNPKSLLFSIAVGKWKNARRKAGRRSALAPAVSFEGFAEDVASDDDPERQALDAALKDCIHGSLVRMDDKFRIPLLLFYFDDCDVEAVSKICKIPRGTVKSRLHKGRALLRESLKKEGFDYG